MKNTFILILFVLAFSEAIEAQPVLNAISPTFGDVVISYSADTTGIDPGNSGANQTWDFSTMNILSTPIPDSIFDPSTSSFYSSFPTATHADVMSNMGSTTIEFSKYTSSELVVLGYRSEASLPAYSYTMVYSDPQTSMIFPFTYNTTFTDDAGGTYSQNSITYTRTWTVTVTGDAWGTLVLPNHTFNNVLRVKTVMSEVMDYGGSTLVSNSEWYMWYNTTNYTHLLVIMISTANISGIVTHQKSVSVSSSATGIKNIWGENEVNLFPNPSHGKAYMNLGEVKDAQVTIVDLAGKVARTYEYSSIDGDVELDIDGLDAGMYLVNLRSPSGSLTKQLVIE